MRQFAVRTVVGLWSLAAVLFAANTAAADVTYAYPTTKSPSFYLVAPESWSATPQGHEDGDENYFYLESDAGTLLAFRTVPGSDYETAMQEHVEYLQENYTALEMFDVKQFNANGLDYVLMPAVGVNEDGDKRQLGSAWFFLPNNEIGEVWYDVAVDDSAEVAVAKAILGSLRN